MDQFYVPASWGELETYLEKVMPTAWDQFNMWAGGSGMHSMAPVAAEALPVAAVELVGVPDFGGA